MAGRSPPDETELRLRIRRWVQYFWREAEKGGLSRQQFAESVDLSGPTISNLLNNKEVPALDTLVKLHYHLGADLRQMVRSDPPLESEAAAARPPAGTTKR